MSEEIMDVTEEITETIVEPAAEEIAEGIDWAKCGIIAGSIALAGACVYGVYKLAPKAIKRIKTCKANHDERKKEKQAENMIMVEDYEVHEVPEDEDNK